MPATMSPAVNVNEANRQGRPFCRRMKRLTAPSFEQVAIVEEPFDEHADIDFRNWAAMRRDLDKKRARLTAGRMMEPFANGKYDLTANLVEFGIDYDDVLLHPKGT